MLTKATTLDEIKDNMAKNKDRLKQWTKEKDLADYHINLATYLKNLT